MKYTIVLLFCLLGIRSSAQKLVSAEYFTDIDPGRGNGTVIVIIPGNSVNTNINIPLSALSNGFHRVYVRVKDSLNHWSLTQSQTYLKEAIPLSGNIITLEYFLDLDPGKGLGTPISFVQGTNINANLVVPISALSTGFHSVYVRAKDQYEKWSIIQIQQFYKDIIPTTPNITSMEYYIDNDPGRGQGTAVSITQNPNVNASLVAPISALSNGFHKICVRAKDQNGKWGITQIQQFYKENIPVSPNITALEYFIDNDPGRGNGISVSVSASTNVSASLIASLSSVSSGMHQLCVRAKDANGNWSLVSRQTFIKESTPLLPKIIAAEYFIDTDSGAGTGNPITISPSTNIIQNFNATISGSLSVGKHRIYVRVKDSLNHWSLIQSDTFKDCNYPATPSITGQTVYCVNDTIKLNASTVSGVTGYLWKGPNNFTGNTQNIQIPNASSLKAGTYTLIAYRSGGTTCDSSLLTSASVVVNSLPVSQSLTVNGKLFFCTGEDSVTLSTTNTLGNKYRWLINGINTSNNADTNSNLIVKLSGTYNVKVTNNNNCISNMHDTIVTVSTKPATPSISGSLVYCANDSIKLNGSALSGVTYLWKGPNNFTAVTQNIVITNADATKAGLYTLRSIRAGGTACDTSLIATVNVIVNPLPSSVSLGVIGKLFFCSGEDSVTLSTTNILGNKYRWLINGVNTSNNADTNSNLIVKLSGTYTVKVTNSNNCKVNMHDTIVTVSAKPATPSISGSLVYCANDSIKLNGSTLSGVTYLWKGPNNYSANTQNIVITNADVTKAGSYTLRTIRTGGTACDTSLTSSVNVIVNSLPASVSLGVSGKLFFCTGEDSVMLSTTNIVGNKYRWLINGVNTSNNADTNSNLIVKLSGAYTVMVTNSNNCKANMRDTIITVSTKPTTPSISGSSVYCVNDSIKLNGSTFSGVTYLWKGPNNFTALTQKIQIPNADVSMSGLYTLSTVRVGGSACDTSYSVSVNIIVNPRPQKQSLLVQGNLSFCKGKDSVELSTIFSTGNTYRWFKNGTISANIADTLNKIMVKVSGDYSVQVFNNFGCSSMMSDTMVMAFILPAPKGISGNLNALPGDTFIYIVSGDSTSSFNWAIKNGIILNGSNNDSITVRWDTAAGTGLITMIETNANGCTGDTNFLSVTINPTQISISPPQIHFGAHADSIVLKINSNDNWVILNSDPWINISKTSGFGSDSILVKVSTNNSQLIRNTTVTVYAGVDQIREISVSQDSIPAMLSLDIDTIYSLFSGDTTAIHISSNTNWTVSSNQLWLTTDTSSGFGNAIIHAICEPNSDTIRNALLTVTAGIQTQKVYVIQNYVSGIDAKRKILQQIIVYPNPGNGIFTVLFGGIIGYKKVEVFNEQGVLIQSGNTETESIQLILTECAKGIYLLKLETPKGFVYSKLFVN